MLHLRDVKVVKFLKSCCNNCQIFSQGRPCQNSNKEVPPNIRNIEHNSVENSWSNIRLDLGL